MPLILNRAETVCFNAMKMRKDGIKMRRRFLTAMITAVLIIAMCAPASLAATDTAKMETYDILKVGKTVYVPSAGWGIYKVTVKNGKVKKVKWLVKSKDGDPDGTYIGSMKKKGKYLYYIMYTEGTSSYLHRVKISSRKREQITKMNISDYAFINDNLYITAWRYDTKEDDYLPMYRTVNLKDKSTQNANIKAEIVNHTSNAKGYSASYKVKGKYVYTYLRTPKGRFKLGKVILEDSYL